MRNKLSKSNLMSKREKADAVRWSRSVPAEPSTHENAKSKKEFKAAGAAPRLSQRNPAQLRASKLFLEEDIPGGPPKHERRPKNQVSASNGSDAIDLRQVFDNDGNGFCLVVVASSTSQAAMAAKLDNFRI
jgi:hypothetical protein